MKTRKDLEKYLGKVEDDFKTFSEKIQFARVNYFKGNNNRRGLCLYIAARKIGISSAYLSQLENGKRSIPNAAIVCSIEKVYGFEVGKLAEVLAKTEVR
jgi:hypothetical protein